MSIYFQSSKSWLLFFNTSVVDSPFRHVYFLSTHRCSRSPYA